ncbi:MULTISPECIES: phage holin family protein [unclassified Sedimentibacter]|uniref:phage holin family protein n=1 Tax=unclassified Sedimentibacter TaxID=2649220 RepID=UPI0027E07D6D|nr:phage holin family protein [Sedimentibacter sp. MB35-C1]WMJ78518.1 phage holin family protein [Sedimentibacter sp. MB35-C1]
MENLNRYTMEIISGYNILIGVVVTIMTAVFGEFWYLFAAFLVFNIIDWLSGWSKARKLKIENSEKGLSGIAKKIWCWVLILVAFMISNIFIVLGNELLNIELDFLTWFGWFTLASLTVNEVRSILENLVEIGINVPFFLIKGLAVTEKLINSKINIPNDGDSDD